MSCFYLNNEVVVVNLGVQSKFSGARKPPAGNLLTVREGGWYLRVFVKEVAWTGVYFQQHRWYWMAIDLLYLYHNITTGRRVSLYCSHSSATTCYYFSNSQRWHHSIEYKGLYVVRKWVFIVHGLENIRSRMKLAEANRKRPKYLLLCFFSTTDSAMYVSQHSSVSDNSGSWFWPQALNCENLSQVKHPRVRQTYLT